MPTLPQPPSRPAQPTQPAQPAQPAGPESPAAELLSRRNALKAAAVAGTLAVPPLLTGAPAAVAAGAEPPELPAGLTAHRSPYLNWSGEIAHHGLWACAPRTPEDVVALANWAHRAGWRLRPRGKAHNWSPLTITPTTADDAKVLLLDTTEHLTALRLESPAPDGVVRAQTGVTVEQLLEFLGGHGLGVTNTPAPGELTLGGVLAIDGHGTSVPADGETPLPGHTYGTLSNLVLRLTAVVWDADEGAYVLRTFDRATDRDADALLTHLGRAFITEAVLQAGPDTPLRCRSRIDLTVDELFAAPGSPLARRGRTFADFMNESGRVEAIWFAYTDKPWLKVWSVSPRRPAASRPTTGPYNYPFSDSLPTPVSRLAGRLVGEGAWYLAPELGAAQYTVAAAGLTATASADLWGPSRDLLMYLRPTTLRETANGYAIVTSRSQVQRVVSEFTSYYRERLEAWAREGRFPVNGQVEIRVSGLDQPADVRAEGARPPLLSVLRPREDRPEWDVAVWVDVLTQPTTPGAMEFYRELERFCLRTFDGGYAETRVEWSKGWGYTATAAWDAEEVISDTVPGTYRAGPAPSWDRAVRTLDRLDPHRVFGNPFLDRLLKL
ncbi:cholesterol oxidase substrate-binding domain-containing protein [Streptomyces sparsogenes]|uniref:cholesterol oxidase substrate-binding domain-containing protein n=1 Tax=Streptomyces sparsogenes TaxID=67365 RepID=UPI0033F41F26